MYALAGPAHRDKREERNEGVKSGERKSGEVGPGVGGARANQSVRERREEQGISKSQ